METLNEFIEKHQKNDEKKQSFVDYLYELLRIHNIEKFPDIYKRANMTRQNWSSIISGKSQPRLDTCVKIALAMHLNNHECKYLLKKAGFTLASSSKFALIIRYAIENKIYDLYEVNKLLDENGCSDMLLV